jgi:S-DNA-T family DNA segregation ATPase FtsK/SpoIIIE
MHLTLNGARGFDTASHGEGGGLIGFAISDFLVSAIGVLGTLLILFITLCVALILLFNIPLARIFALSVQAVRNVHAFFVNLLRAWSSRPPRPVLDVKPLARVNPGRPPKTEPRRVETTEAQPPPGVPAAQRPALAARIVGGQALAPQAPRVHREWRLPNVADLLEDSVEQDISAQEIRTKVRQIEETLTHFGVPAKVIEVNQGPTITQFGIEPGFLEQKSPDGSLRRTKVKVSRISALLHDLELALAAAPVRVEAPVPGKSIVGIEVPNEQISRVSLRGVMESE